MLSSRGSVSVDESHQHAAGRRIPPSRIADVRRLVATLDIPVKQVEIEARIVIVNNDFERELGAILGVTAQRQQRRERPAGDHRHDHRPAA